MVSEIFENGGRRADDGRTDAGYLHILIVHMAYTCLIVLDPEIPFYLPEMKGKSGTDGANY